MAAGPMIPGAFLAPSATCCSAFSPRNLVPLEQPSPGSLSRTRSSCASRSSSTRYAADRMGRAQRSQMHPVGGHPAGAAVGVRAGRFRARQPHPDSAPASPNTVRALDFYGGFYFQPQDDRAVRAPGRDPFAHGRKLHDRAVQVPGAQAPSSRQCTGWNQPVIPHSLTSQQGVGPSAVAAPAKRSSRPHIFSANLNDFRRSRPF